MKCTVLLFAQLADAVGARKMTLALDEGATVGDALDALAEQHPAVAEVRHIVAVALDERYVLPTATVRDGCTIALIPPVSGG